MTKEYQVLNAVFEEEELEVYRFNDFKVLKGEDDLAMYLIGTCQELNEYIRFEVLSLRNMPTWQFNYLLNKYNQAVKEIQTIAEKVQSNNLIGMAVYYDDNEIIIANVDIETL